MAAFEVCASLDPADASYQEILAELFERQRGAAAARRWRTGGCCWSGRWARGDRPAPARHAEVAQRGQAGRPGLVHVRRPGGLRAGRAARSGSGTTALAGRPLARPRAALSEEMWQRALYHPRRTAACPGCSRPWPPR